MLNRRKVISGLLGVAYMDRLTAMSLKQDRLEEAAALIKKSTESGEVSAASLYVRQREAVFQRAFGRAHDPASVFLLASITKPMTAIAVMVLADRGQLALSDPVRKYIPEFAGGERDLVTIRHLLTHTSGLPDQLEENIQLRKRHAPLKDFVTALEQTEAVHLDAYLRRSDFSRWITEVFGDFPLGKTVRQMEDQYRTGARPDVVLGIAQAVRARYDFPPALAETPAEGTLTEPAMVPAEAATKT
jgi:CubicO group peptidase (beta-lactamase class C family)